MRTGGSLRKCACGRAQPENRRKGNGEREREEKIPRRTNEKLTKEKKKNESINNKHVV